MMDESGFDLRSGLVRLLTREGNNYVSAGTGWVVDLEGGLIVTANHVIKNIERKRRKKAKTVYLQFYAELLTDSKNLNKKSAVVLHEHRDELHDVCFLRYESRLPPEVRAFPLGRADSMRAPVKVYGFPFPDKGDVEEVMTTSLPGQQEEKSGLTIFKLEGEQNIKPGFSGGPVLNLETGNIVGLIRSISRDAVTGQTLRVTVRTSESIREVMPDLVYQEAFDTELQESKRFIPKIRKKLEKYAHEILTGANGRNLYNEVGESNNASNLEEKLERNFNAYFPVIGVEVVTREREEEYDENEQGEGGEEGFDNDRDDDQRGKGNKASENHVPQIETSSVASGKLKELAAKHSRLLIRATAGSGKTTTLKAILVENCRKFRNAATGETPTITLFVRARDFTETIRFRELILEQLGFTTDKEAQQLFLALMHFPGIQICVDGLNEIPSALAEKALNDLQRIVDGYPETKFILTDRPSLYGKSAFLEKVTLPFRVFDIRPLQETDYADYLLKLLEKRKTRKKNESTEDRHSRLRKEAHKMIAGFNKNEATRELIRTPLYLDMLAQVSKGIRAVTSRSGIFDKFSEDFVEKKWPESKKFDKEEVTNCLERMAYEMINSSQPTFGQLQGWLERENLTKVEVKGLVETGLKFNFFIRNGNTNKIIEGTYAFNHDAFRDYYAARYVVKSFKANVSLRLEEAEKKQSDSEEEEATSPNETEVEPFEYLPERVDIKSEVWFQPLLLTAEILSKLKYEWTLFYFLLKRLPIEVKKNGKKEIIQPANLDYSPLKKTLVRVKDREKHTFFKESRTVGIVETETRKNALIRMGLITDISLEDLRIAPLTSAIAKQRIALAKDKKLKAAEVSSLKCYVQFWLDYYFITGREVIPVEGLFTALATLDFDEFKDLMLTDPDLISVWSKPFRFEDSISDEYLIMQDRFPKVVLDEKGFHTPENKEIFTGQLRKRRREEKNRRQEEFKAISLVADRAVSAYTQAIDRPWEMYSYIVNGRYLEAEEERKSQDVFTDYDSLPEDQKASNRVLGLKPQPVSEEGRKLLERYIKLPKKSKQKGPGQKKITDSVSSTIKNERKEIPLSFRWERAELRRRLLEATAKVSPDKVKSIFEEYLDFDALPLTGVDDEVYFVNALRQLDRTLAEYEEKVTGEEAIVFSQFLYQADYVLQDNAATEDSNITVEDRTLQLAKQIIISHPRIPVEYARDVQAQSSLNELIEFYLEASKNIPADLIRELREIGATPGQSVSPEQKANWLALFIKHAQNYLAFSAVLFDYVRVFSGKSSWKREAALIDIVSYGLQEGVLTEALVNNLNTAFRKSKKREPYLSLIKRLLAEGTFGQSRLRLSLGEYYLRLKKWSLATAICQEAHKLYPKDLSPLFLLATIASRRGTYEEALDYYNRILEDSPGNLIAIGGKGDCAYNLGEYREAALCFETELQDNDNNFIATRYLGRAYLQLGNFKDAETQLVHAYRLYEQSGTAEIEKEKTLSTLVALYATGHPDIEEDAGEYFAEELREILEFRLSYRDTLRIAFRDGLTQYYALKKEFDKAVGLWEKILQKPRFPVGELLNFVDNWINLGHGEVALRVLKIFEQHHPIGPDTLWMFTQAYHVAGRPKEAQNYWIELLFSTVSDAEAKKDRILFVINEFCAWAAETMEPQGIMAILIQILPDIRLLKPKSLVRESIISLSYTTPARFNISTLHNVLELFSKREKIELLNVIADNYRQLGDLRELYLIYDHQLELAQSNKEALGIYDRKIAVAVDVGDYDIAKNILWHLIKVELLPLKRVVTALNDIIFFADESKNIQAKYAALHELVKHTPSFKERKNLYGQLLRVGKQLGDKAGVKNIFYTLIKQAKSKKERDQLSKKYFNAYVGWANRNQKPKEAKARQETKIPAILEKEKPAGQQHSALRLFSKLLIMNLNSAVYLDLSSLTDARNRIFDITAVVQAINKIDGIELISQQIAYLPVAAGNPELLTELSALKIRPFALNEANSHSPVTAIGFDVLETLYAAGHVENFIVVSDSPMSGLLKNRLAAKNKKLIVLASDDRIAADLTALGTAHLCLSIPGLLQAGATNDATKKPSKAPKKEKKPPTKKKLQSPEEILDELVTEYAKEKPTTEEERYKLLKKFVVSMADSRPLKSYLNTTNLTISKLLAFLRKILPDLTYQEFCTPKLRPLIRTLCTDTKLGVYSIENSPYDYVGFLDDFNCSEPFRLNDPLPRITFGTEEHYRYVLKTGQKTLSLMDDRMVMRGIVNGICEIDPKQQEASSILEELKARTGTLYEEKQIKHALSLMKVIGSFVDSSSPSSGATLTLRRDFAGDYFAWRDHLLEYCVENLAEKMSAPPNKETLQFML